MSTDQRIFISYRRSDSRMQANGLSEALRGRLPSAQVFMDIDSIPPGADFETHIRDEINRCNVVLVLIGDDWLSPTNDGTRRIDDPKDWVRAEVETALQTKEVLVIPILVEGASMPTASELPEDLAPLARRNAFTLSVDHWNRDMAELTRHLKGAEPEPPSPGQADATVTFTDIDINAVKYAVGQLPPQFATKDVSTHPAMLATHEDVAGRSNYHTIVGRFLMQKRSELGLGSPDAPQDDRGSRWTKVARPPGAHAAPIAPRAAAPAAALTPRQMPPAAPSFGRAALVSTPAQRVPPPNRPPSQPKMSKWLVALPVITVGLAAFVHPSGRRRRRSTTLAAGGSCLIAASLGVAALLGFSLIGSSPEDAEGTATDRSRTSE